jgi:hypothetical protein
MKLILPKKIADRARRQARSCFPKESYLELVGRISKNNKTITIIDTYIPSDLDEYNGPDSVMIPPHWRKESKKYAESIGGIIVGSIHSHPYSFDYCKIHPGYTCDVSPSAADWEYNGDEIMGILVIREGKDGRLVTSLKMYGPIVHLDVRYN